MFKKSTVKISPSYSFQDNAPVYLFSNENIADQLRVLGDFNGARVLSVGASGDHAFGAYLAGAAHVDTFDINSLQRAVIDLKTVMVQHVSYENFMDFFFDERQFFNTRILSQIQSKIPNNVQRMLQDYQLRGKNLFKYEAGQNSAYSTKNIPYLKNKKSYIQLRNVLPRRIPFYHCDMRDIKTPFADVTGMVGGRYDVILLSNIYDYVVPSSAVLSQEDNMKYFYREILEPMARRLLVRDGGRIAFRYMWASSPVAWTNYIDMVANKMIGNSVLKSYRHTIHVRSFPSNQKGFDWDSVLFMKQR
jgi:hypothetical protein